MDFLCFSYSRIGTPIGKTKEIHGKINEIRPTSAPPISNIPKNYPKPCEIWGPADREIPSFIFYMDRISPDTSTHPKTRDENDPKMSPNRWFCVMPYRSQSCSKRVLVWTSDHSKSTRTIIETYRALLASCLGFLGHRATLLFLSHSSILTADRTARID